MKQRVCDVCGKKFHPCNESQKRCGKECSEISRCAYMKAYRMLPKNKEKQKKRRHTQRFRAAQKKYNQSPERKKAQKKYGQSESLKKRMRTPEYKAVQKKHRQTPNYKAAQKKYQSRMRATSPDYCLNESMRGGMNKSLKGNKRSRAWSSLVDYTLQELSEHLESQFTEGMTWDNHGINGWHIDHIRPISSFSFTSPDDDEFKQCWALSNLQPLWAHDNRRKGSKYDATAAQAA